MTEKPRKDSGSVHVNFRRRKHAIVYERMLKWAEETGDPVSLPAYLLMASNFYEKWTRK